MSLIADASVAVKWAITEPETSRAMALVGTAPIIGPDLVVPEVMNVLWKKELRGELAAGQRAAAVAASLSGFTEIVPTMQYAERALDLAVTLKHPAYDCFYLALAEVRGGTLVTADARLLNVLQQGGWSGKFQAL